jgi:hypothetical protein
MKYSSLLSLSLSLMGLCSIDLAQAIEPPINQPLENVKEFVNRNGIQADRLPPANLRAQLDQLCHQRDCHASQVYWHTDLEAAKEQARQFNRPILSLRLLGNLDEELSCANSRFFRVALYANGQISQQLRDRFILHWSSERPVPKVTIDFKDGRKLESTVTGNSIHYLLDSDGKPIDALPGLYSPQAFAEQLSQFETLFVQYQKQTPKDRPNFLLDYHRNRLVQQQIHWNEQLKQVGVENIPKLAEIPSTDALTAAQRTYAKLLVEFPVLQAIVSTTRNQNILQKATNEVGWQKLADRILAQLDRNSLALMQAKLVTPTKLKSTAQQFEQVLAIDTVRNEYLLRPQIHEWFLRNSSTPNFSQLNQWVYAELFLTPATDSWLGLDPSGTFSAIEKAGILK